MWKGSNGGSETRFVSEGNKAITLLENFQALPLIYRSTESILISNYFPGYRTHLSVSSCTSMFMLFHSWSQFVFGVYNHALNSSVYKALNGRIHINEIEKYGKNCLGLKLCTISQVPANFPEICDPPENFRRKKDDMKEVLHWKPPSIWCHRTKSSRPGICLPLPYRLFFVGGGCDCMRKVTNYLGQHGRSPGLISDTGPPKR